MPKIPTKRKNPKKPTVKRKTKRALRSAFNRANKDVSQIYWGGPVEDGITQSLIQKYLECKERFRVRTILGLSTPESFHPPIHYGEMFHLCEEHHTAGKPWLPPLKKYAKSLANEFKTQQEAVDKWFNVCKVQYPIYLDYWKDEPDILNKEPVVQEHSFNVPYRLPSGRTVKLLGKWDSVDIIDGRLFLQENKTKYQIDSLKIQNKLHFDLQTMFYLNSMEFSDILPDGLEVAGVRYNVIRRPLSGGVGSIRQHKATKTKPAESKTQFYKRLGEVITDNAPTFFERFKAELESGDLSIFRTNFLNPILENITDDYEWWKYCFEKGKDPFDYGIRESSFPDHRSRHWTFPYGTFSGLVDGRGTDLDFYVRTGSTTGLEKVELFPEL